MKVVVDASAVLTLLLRAPSAEKVADRLRTARGSVSAPHLLDVEVTQILRRHAAADAGQIKRCQQALHDLWRMPLFRYPHAPLLDRVWKLRSRMTTSDAVYVALAEFLDAPILTFNNRLETQRHNAKIELLSTTQT